MNQYIGKWCRRVCDVGRPQKGTEEAADLAVYLFWLVFGVWSLVVIELLLACVHGCLVGLIVDHEQRTRFSIPVRCQYFEDPVVEVCENCCVLLHHQQDWALLDSCAEIAGKRLLEVAIWR